MSIMEKLGRAAGEIGTSAEEAFNNIKGKVEESITPEKQQEIKEKLDRGLENAGRVADNVSGKLEKGFDEFMTGFNSGKGDK